MFYIKLLYIFYLYIMCFLYCKDERFYLNRLRLHHTVRSTDSSWLLQMLFTKCLTFWIYCSSDATSAFLMHQHLIEWTEQALRVKRNYKVLRSQALIQKQRHSTFEFTIGFWMEITVWLFVCFYSCLLFCIILVLNGILKIPLPNAYISME